MSCKLMKFQSVVFFHQLIASNYELYTLCARIHKTFSMPFWQTYFSRLANKRASFSCCYLYGGDIGGEDVGGVDAGVEEALLDGGAQRGDDVGAQVRLGEAGGEVGEGARRLRKVDDDVEEAADARVRVVRVHEVGQLPLVAGQVLRELALRWVRLAARRVDEPYPADHDLLQPLAMTERQSIRDS